MNICLFSDSLSLPRITETDYLKYQETYPYLTNSILKKILLNIEFDFITFGNRGSTVVYSYKQIGSEIINFMPDIIVLQAGIVDCAPRVFSRLEQNIVNRLGSFTKYIVAFAHNNRRRIIRIMPPKVYVKYKKFSYTVDQLCSLVLKHGKALLIINIAPTNSHTEYRSPGLQENIKLYNEVLSSVCDGKRVRLVDIHSEIINLGVEKMILDDGIHLSKIGNELLATMLSDELLDTVNIIFGEVALEE